MPRFTVNTILSGYRGSLWVNDKNSNILWGNRNAEIDVAGKITGAWQIFYPFQKIILEKIENEYDGSTDLTNLNYPEYPHTQLFFYNSNLPFVKDTTFSWGNEKNFTAADTSFESYYFNSRIKVIPIVKSSTTNYQYLAVRGYTPTENSETMLRFIVPNRYTFGYVTINNIINEIQLSQNIVNSSLYDLDYTNTLSNFNAAYKQSNVFGANLIPSFNGITISTSNFSHYTSIFNSNYSLYQFNSSTLKIINDYVNSNTFIFISNQLKNFFPEHN